MKANDFFEYCDLQIFEIEGKTRNDLLILDTKLNEYYNEMTSTKIFNIILSKYPEIFYFITQCISNQIKLSKLKEGELKQYELENDQKNFIYSKKKVEELKSKIPKDEMISILLDPKLNKISYSLFREFITINKIMIKGITFNPINERIIETNGKKYFNIYKNISLYENEKATQTKDFYHIEFIFKNMLGEGYEYFMKFLAWKIQFPTKPIDCHFVIQDDGGTGKSKILSNIISRMINSVTISQSELESNHNEFMENTLIVFAEEIEGFKDAKKIKYYTGVGSLIRINPKGISSYNIINYTNWIFLSNDLDTIKINETDRRFAVIGGGKRLVPLSDNDWSVTPFKDQKENTEFFDSKNGYHNNFEKEVKNLYKYLKGLQVQKSDLLVNLPTLRKELLIEENSGAEYKFLKELNEFKLDWMVNTYLNCKSLDDQIVNIEDNNNGGTWIKSKLIYDLFKAYYKENYDSSHKTLSKITFFKRIKATKQYKTYFDETKVISHGGEKFQALRIKQIKK